MSYFTDKIKNHIGPEIIFKTELNGKKIEIFGEEHNTELEEPNFYQELLKHEDYSKALVLVEHATVLCELKPGDDEKFEEVIKFSGSELVFYQSIKNNLNPVICVDNRIELGLMSNIEERLLRDILEVLKNNQASKKTRNNIKVILDRLKIVIQQFKLIQESGDNQDYYKDYQNLYELYQEIFGRQILILERLSTMLISDLKKKNILNELDITNYQYAVLLLQHFYQNILQLSSLTVDINILNILKTESHKKETENILIFTGLNHAIRLFTFINKTQNRDDSDKTIVCQSYLDLGNNHIIDKFDHANPYPYFNVDIENLMLEHFKKN